MSFDWDPRFTYNQYFASGAYDDRYPQSNSHTLQILLNHIHQFPSPHILDFGCGDGRYALPLLQRTNADLVAYDISDMAIKNLQRNVSSLSLNLRSKITLVEGEIDKLKDYAPFDMVMVMFGVLSHISGYQNRLDILRRIAGLLRSDGQGILILSVPNAFRRFFLEQLKCNLLGRLGSPISEDNQTGNIVYSRSFNPTTQVSMYYHLYTPHSLTQELGAVGFETKAILPESILPESVVTQYQALGVGDRWLSSWLPASLGYGLLAIAQIQPTHSPNLE
jgi:2-polyprenyl-3-methyl-5-hydroxy-6-metoxy-1,4-benzoquinol methylase